LVGCLLGATVGVIGEIHTYVTLQTSHRRSNCACQQARRYSTEEAYDIGYDVYDQEYKDLLKLGQYVVAGWMRDDRDCLKRWGVPRAVARPIGIVVTVP
jgi:hypothetical protein